MLFSTHYYAVYSELRDFTDTKVAFRKDICRTKIDSDFISRIQSDISVVQLSLMTTRRGKSCQDEMEHV